jgi:peptidoglycan/xylan/chitin deacetylase (PgdA/CDA1 family)
MVVHESMIPVLMYHEVTDIPEKKKKIRKIDPEYSLSMSSFEEHMDYLFENGYQTISCDELIDEQSTASKKFVLTFDDGLAGNYKIAFPILKRYGFTATIFVVVDGISTERFMSWAQLRDLAENGFMIQSHTMTHADLRRLSAQEILYELSESKKIIEKNVGQEVKYLSLPFGSGDKNVFRIAYDIGYTVIFTSSYYQMNMNHIPAIVGRIPIKSGYSKKKYEDLLTKNPNQLIMIMIKKMIKDIIKRVVGLNNYRKVYRLFYNIKLD